MGFGGTNILLPDRPHLTRGLSVQVQTTKPVTIQQPMQRTIQKVVEGQKIVEASRVNISLFPCSQFSLPQALSGGVSHA